MIPQQFLPDGSGCRPPFGAGFGGRRVVPVVCKTALTVMNNLPYLLALTAAVTAAAGATTPVSPGSAALDPEAAERFARLALACVRKEYPNKISHVLNSDADVAPPRRLTPAFYGCYDWHSAVHGHWLLARLLRVFPEAPFAKQARDALEQSLTAENLKQEAIYVRGEGRSTFERPYGLSWLLQLCAELPKLSSPVRIGEHNQTAFSLGLMLDYARTSRNTAFERIIVDSAEKFFLNDKSCPLNYEPSGEDFLSPCL